MNTSEKRNYQQELDSVIEHNGSARPSLLLHSCCGPCSSSVLEYLTQFFHITLFWYNPNIYPQEEFDRRLQAQQRLISAMGLRDVVKIHIVPREAAPWYDAVHGLEKEPEGGERCTECFRLRLREAAAYAAQNGFEWFCSTLTLSRHKDPVRINALGEAFASEYGVRWLPSEFKKRGRELRSRQLCAQYDIYRQDYCGCEFSLRRPQQISAASSGSITSGILKHTPDNRTSDQAKQ